MGQTMFKNQQKVETPNVSPSLVSEEIHEPNSVSSPPPSSPPTINKSTGNVEIPHSLLTEIIFTDEELSNYLAPHPPTIEPSTTSYFANPEIKVSIILMPHKHTLFCERKERVCSAVGKVQEQEILKVKGIPSTTLHGCYWIRSVPDDPYSSYEYIEGSENSDQYILTAKDEKRYISFQQGSVGTALNGETTVCCHRAINSIGPVLPGPPRLLDLRIVGSCVKGGRVFAESKYIGGTEGPSEYWWFRIKAGKRIQIGEPKVASDSVTLDDIKTSLSGIEENGCLCDPRVLQLSDEDVGCVLKVKCRPVRIDGYKGEVFTSRPSEVVVESEKLEVLSIAEVDIDDSGKHDKDDGC